MLTVLLGYLLCSVNGFARMHSKKGSLRLAPRVSLSEQIVGMAEDEVDVGNDRNKLDKAQVYQGSGARVYKPRGAASMGVEVARDHTNRAVAEGSANTTALLIKERIWFVPPRELVIVREMECIDEAVEHLH